LFYGALISKRRKGWGVGVGRAYQRLLHKQREVAPANLVIFLECRVHFTGHEVCAFRIPAARCVAVIVTPIRIWCGARLSPDPTKWAFGYAEALKHCGVGLEFID
jgi:hypothetical protein